VSRRGEGRFQLKFTTLRKRRIRRRKSRERAPIDLRHAMRRRRAGFAAFQRWLPQRSEDYNPL
jgi:hypothetical protein